MNKENKIKYAGYQKQKIAKIREKIAKKIAKKNLKTEKQIKMKKNSESDPEEQNTDPEVLSTIDQRPRTTSCKGKDSPEVKTEDSPKILVHQQLNQMGRMQPTILKYLNRV